MDRTPRAQAPGRALAAARAWAPDSPQRAVVWLSAARPWVPASAARASRSARGSAPRWRRWQGRVAEGGTSVAVAVGGAGVKVGICRLGGRGRRDGLPCGAAAQRQRHQDGRRQHPDQNSARVQFLPDCAIHRLLSHILVDQESVPSIITVSPRPRVPVSWCLAQFAGTLSSSGSAAEGGRGRSQCSNVTPAADRNATAFSSG